MAFRKKTYQEIVDDILTDVTGGVVDEEHTYDPATDTYHLGGSPVRSNGIVSVRGTVDGAAHTFAGSDYQLDVNGELAWIGTAPDDGTTFFVNYYPEDAASPITDRNIGSVTRTVVEALGREMATLYGQLDKVYLSAFVDTAEGRSLEFVVSLLGMERILAGRAVGEVEFSRSTPAAGDITIPLSTLVSDREDNRYETTERATLRQGQLAVEVPVRAVSEDVSILGARVLTLMPRPVVGIEAVVNHEATTRGTRDETDEELRARAKVALYGAGKATIEAIRFAVLEQGVNSVVIRDMPQGVPGELDVIIDYEGDPAAKEDAVQRAIEQTRAAGIRVNLNPTDRVKLLLDLTVTLTAELLSDEQAVLRRSIQRQIADYVASLAAGKPVAANKIIALVMADPRVQDVSFEAQKGDQVVPSGDIPVGQMEKVYIQNVDTDIAVTFQVAPAEALPTEVAKGPTPIKIEAMVQISGLTDEFVSSVGQMSGAQERAKSIIQAKVQAFVAELFAGDAIVFANLLDLLASDKYTVDEGRTQLRDTHVVDGLVVTLKQRDDTDRVRESEQVELAAVTVSFD
jgi:uncharacterized phage protein gp47/JayE